MAQSLKAILAAVIFVLLFAVSCAELGAKINGPECDPRNPSSDAQQNCSVPVRERNTAVDHDRK